MRRECDPTTSARQGRATCAAVGIASLPGSREPCIRRVPADRRQPRHVLPGWAIRRGAEHPPCRTRGTPDSCRDSIGWQRTESTGSRKPRRLPTPDDGSAAIAPGSATRHPPERPDQPRLDLRRQGRLGLPSTQRPRVAGGRWDDLGAGPDHRGSPFDQSSDSADRLGCNTVVTRPGSHGRTRIRCR